MGQPFGYGNSYDQNGNGGTGYVSGGSASPITPPGANGSVNGTIPYYNGGYLPYDPSTGAGAPSQSGNGGFNAGTNNYPGGPISPIQNPTPSFNSGIPQLNFDSGWKLQNGMTTNSDGFWFNGQNGMMPQLGNQTINPYSTLGSYYGPQGGPNGASPGGQFNLFSGAMPTDLPGNSSWGQASRDWNNYGNNLNAWNNQFGQAEYNSYQNNPYYNYSVDPVWAPWINQNLNGGLMMNNANAAYQNSYNNFLNAGYFGGTTPLPGAASGGR